MRGMRALAVVGLAVILGASTGCGALLQLLQPNTTTLQLINPGSFPVEVEIYISDEQNTLEGILTSGDPDIERTIQAGETITITRDCDSLQAVIIDRASVQVVGSIGPEDGTEVLRDGDDFGCGDTITFTFDYPSIPTDLDITVDVQSDNTL